MKRLPLWFRLARWSCVLGAVLSILIWLATIPAYFFATPGRNHYIRIETGRINYEYEPRGFNGDNGIAPNREPMRWLLDFHFYPGGAWFVRLPLWIPTLVFSSVAIAMFVLPRRRRGLCRCGYALDGLAATAGVVTCPECGRRIELPPGPPGNEAR